MYEKLSSEFCCQIFAAFGYCELGFPIALASPSVYNFFLPWCNSPIGPRPPLCRGFMITLRHTTLGRTPLDEWQTRRRDLYLTPYITHRRQTSIAPAGFEPTIPASERPQTHALVRTSTEIRLYNCSIEIAKAPPIGRCIKLGLKYYTDVQRIHYVTKFHILFLIASTAHPKYDLTL